MADETGDDTNNPNSCNNGYFSCNYTLAIRYVSGLVNWLIDGAWQLTYDSEMVCSSRVLWF